MPDSSDSTLAGLIDHTLLKPDALASQVETLCREAVQHHFAAVCVNPVHVSLCASLVAGSQVQVCTVVGFPLGASLARVKAYEAEQAIKDGAEEIDMVINIGALKAGQHQTVLEDIQAVAHVCQQTNRLLKVIIEAALLSDQEKVIACQLAQQAGADYVKTSTGFGPGGATLHDVALMRQTVGPEMGVKAAGGVRTFEDAQAMVQAGATRIGASSSIKIVLGEKAA